MLHGRSTIRGVWPHGMARGWPEQLGGADAGRRRQSGRADPRVTDHIRTRRKVLESSVPRVDEPAATS
eukprot:scaffold12656_cov63-Phaeocystis_antarctica.AAC.1